MPEPIEKTATRNMFYDEQGKHVRTKKEILDDMFEERVIVLRKVLSAEIKVKHRILLPFDVVVPVNGKTSEKLALTKKERLKS